MKNTLRCNHSDHSQNIFEAKDKIVIKTEQQINFSYELLIKHRKIIEKIYQRLRSTGSQQARFSELAKKDTKQIHL